MTELDLTKQQAHFLKLLQGAESAGLTVAKLAEQEGIPKSRLYNYRSILRRKGHLPPARSGSDKKIWRGSSFIQASALKSGDTNLSDTLELKTQLANGQPVWISLTVSQLPAILTALSA